jgi:hypothetical protein
MGIGYQKEIDNNPQSQTSPLFQYFAIEELKTDITLTADVSIDDEKVNVSAGHGFTGVVDEKIVIFDGETYIQSSVKSVNVNEIELYIPSDRPINSATAQVIRGSCELRKDASAAPIDFLWKPRQAETPIDISKVVITIFCGAQTPDLSKFGGAAKLATGMFFRHVNGVRNNLGTYRDNRDFSDFGAHVEIGTKGPGGTNSVIITFDIEEIFKQVERFYPKNGDYFLARSRDNLAVAGIDSMTMTIIGSYTKGEV